MSDGTVSLSGVSLHARADGAARDASGARPVGLFDVRLELDAPSVLGVLGAHEDGVGLLVDVLSGRARPERGKVRVGGADPSRSAATRARIGALGAWSPSAEVDPPLGATVLRAVANAVSIRAGSAPNLEAARELLQRYGLGALVERATPSLSTADARGIELALALETPRPALLVLADPFSRVGAIDVGLVRDRIHAIARVAPVIVTSPSLADLKRVGDEIAVLSRGTFARGEAATARLVGRGPAEMRVWLASRSRDALRVLLETPGIIGASWEPTPGAEAADDAGLLRVQHAAIDELALAIADAVVKVDARVVSLSEVTR